MTNALIGYTGFVGSTLLKQVEFESLYRSTNIQDIRNRLFETVVCAGAPGQKWIANRQPENDRKAIDDLISHIKTVKCTTFILISTVDVFSNPINVFESTQIDEAGLHPYGKHRRLLEKFVEDNFSNYLIIRLPGLVGPRLRKNVIFDFLNNNNLQSIDCRNVFQFYPMVNLWYDIKTALSAKLSHVHLTAEPISTADVALDGFGKTFDLVTGNSPVEYDMRTLHARHFGSPNDYQYSKQQTLQAIRAYAQSEHPTLQPEAGPKT